MLQRCGVCICSGFWPSPGRHGDRESAGVAGRGGGRRGVGRPSLGLGGVTSGKIGGGAATRDHELHGGNEASEARCLVGGRDKVEGYNGLFI